MESLDRDDKLLLLTYEWINREMIASMLQRISADRESAPDVSDLQQEIETETKENKDYPD